MTALASLLGDGAVSDFNFAFALLQIPLGIIGVPLGIVVLPIAVARRRGRSRGGVRGAADPGPAAADLRDGPDRRPDRGRPPAGRRDPVRRRQDPTGRPRPHRGHPASASSIGLTAHALIAVLARAFYARQDTVTPVAAAVGAVAINCTLAVVLVGPLGLPGIALAIAIAAWIEALVLLAILYRRLPHFELRGLGRVGVEAVVGSVVAGRRRGRRRSGSIERRRSGASPGGSS